MTTTTNPRPDVPLPAGAVTGQWHHSSTEDELRYFEGTPRVVDADGDCAAISVVIAGLQRPDGSVEQRRIVVKQTYHCDVEMTSGQAIQLALNVALAEGEYKKLEAQP
jgi:hypothetical protein